MAMLLLTVASASLHLRLLPPESLANAAVTHRASTLVSCDRSPGQLGGRVPPPGGDAEYEAALAEAHLASARLAAAERHLKKAAELSPTAPPSRKPRGARTRISRSDAGTLLIEVPAAGLSQGTLVGGAFSVAWFSTIIPATASMLSTGGVSALFMAPFWLAGGAVAKQTVLDPARATSLSIGEFAWEIQRRVTKVPLSAASGSTEELEGCSVEVAAYVNGVPSYHLLLYSGTQSWSIGDGLSAVELEWVAGEVNAHLGTLRSGPRTTGDGEDSVWGKVQ